MIPLSVNLTLNICKNYNHISRTCVILQNRCINMKPLSTKFGFMKKKFIAYFFIIFFSIPFSFSFAHAPGKCCTKADSLAVETKNLDPLKDLKCTKEEDKKDKNFTMMSLNLMYYLVNKFISTSSFEQD